MGTILILGATSDIGFAIAKKFAAHNYTVHLAGRNIRQLQVLQSDLQIRYNVECFVNKFDALDFKSHRQFYDGLHPKPTVCVYSIGYLHDNLECMKDWNLSSYTIDANYKGAVSILNVIAENFIKNRTGTIVGISSVAGLRGRQSNFIYGSAKAAFITYLSGLRNLLYHEGVHVMTVLPGFVYTKMTEGFDLPKLLTAEPQEVANVVYHGVCKKKDIVYIKWLWRWIMLLITALPEKLFKTRKL